VIQFGAGCHSTAPARPGPALRFRCQPQLQTSLRAARASFGKWSCVCFSPRPPPPVASLPPSTAAAAAATVRPPRPPPPPALAPTLHRSRYFPARRHAAREASQLLSPLSPRSTRHRHATSAASAASAAAAAAPPPCPVFQPRSRAPRLASVPRCKHAVRERDPYWRRLSITARRLPLPPHRRRRRRRHPAAAAPPAPPLSLRRSTAVATRPAARRCRPHEAMIW